MDEEYFCNIPAISPAIESLPIVRMSLSVTLEEPFRFSVEAKPPPPEVWFVSEVDAAASDSFGSLFFFFSGLVSVVGAEITPGILTTGESGYREGSKGERKKAVRMRIMCSEC